MDSEEPRRIGSRAASSPALVPSFSMAPLEFRKYPDHLQQHGAGRSSDADSLGQAAKSGSGFPQPLHDRQGITERPREAVELSNHEDITLPEMLQQAMKFRSVPASAGGFLTICAHTGQL